MLKPERRRQHLGAYTSAALPLVWSALASRGWTHSRLATELEEAHGKVAKMLYGDRRPGRDLAVKMSRILDIPFDAWGEPCPKNWRPHRVLRARKSESGSVIVPSSHREAS